jgi:hypothetical protein
MQTPFRESNHVLATRHVVEADERKSGNNIRGLQPRTPHIAKGVPY